MNELGIFLFLNLLLSYQTYITLVIGEIIFIRLHTIGNYERLSVTYPRQHLLSMVIRST